MFSEIVLDHFQHPRNAGELAGATSVVEVSNPVCGDVLRLAVIVEGGIVREARFLCRGCTASIASASVLTEKVKGRRVSELKEMHAAEIAAELGGLPPASFHAAQLAEDAVKAIALKIADHPTRLTP
ncbi:MAG TPA: iron-sulfur cluster assembly scaffold protein [Candidatus Acidoferrum sp.]|nr:iron-sulfur cluster assembly scaffold protein [Candidatus Acidoferrum sp.]